MKLASNIPNLFIVGAPKSGTTALASNLALHPEIFISELKEPRFFDAHVFYDNKSDYPMKSLSEYLKLFDSDRAKNCTYRLDASVFNMYSEAAIDNILQISPDAKFILILRDPVEASVSMHKQRLKYPSGGMRELSDDFLECWNMLEDRKIGRKYPKDCRNKFIFRYDLLYSYEKYVPFMVSKVDSKNLFIGFYDDYKNCSSEFFKSIFDFLDIKSINIENKKYNESYIIKKSYFLEFVQFLANSTFVLRKKIGLTGGKLLFLKKYIYNFYKTSGKNYSSDLSPIKEYFHSTYEYLEGLRNNVRK